MASKESEKTIAISVIMYEPEGMSEAEVMNLASLTKDSFTKTGIFKGVNIPHDMVIWRDRPLVSMFVYSIEKGADYLLIISPRKAENIFEGVAKLIDLSTKEEIHIFEQSWGVEPQALSVDVERMTLEVIFESTGKIKVHYEFETNPSNCDVYKDGERFDNTGDNGHSSDTVWWKKGKHIITICRVGHEDWEEEYDFCENPTEYRRKITLEEK